MQAPESDPQEEKVARPNVRKRGLSDTSSEQLVNNKTNVTGSSPSEGPADSSLEPRKKNKVSLAHLGDEEDEDAE